MDALMMVGGLGIAGIAAWGIMAWFDPQGADKLAAKLRGRAVELRMLAEARKEARARAQQTEKGCLREWGAATEMATETSEKVEATHANG